MKKDFKLKGRLGLYMKWPVYLSVILLAANIMVFFFNLQAGFFMLIFTLIYIISALLIYLYNRPALTRDLTLFSIDYAQAQRTILRDMHIPYGIIDENGLIIWQNTALTNVSQNQTRERRYLQDIFPELDNLNVSDVKSTVEYEVTSHDKYYRIIIEQLFLENDILSESELTALNETEVSADLSKTVLCVVYFLDETDIVNYRHELEDQKLFVGLSYIDNYEEVLESVEDVRRSLLVALLDRRISKYFAGYNGLVRKLDNDKYLILIKQKDLNAVRENRFSILEDVKSITIGNDLPMTLSIGFSQSDEGYNTSSTQARMAIDMALGRGGDQAVIKNADSFEYFGGKSKQLEKNTRVKARVKAHALRELVEDKDKVFVMGHKLGDIDCFGSAVGIYRAMTALNKKTHIVYNEYNSSVKPMLSRFQPPDYPSDLFINSKTALELFNDESVLILVDVNNLQIVDSIELVRRSSVRVVLDHHRQTSDSITNATLSYIEPYASSTCELVAEILQYISEDIKIRPAEADAMYGGIIIDTNDFTNQTGVRTFEAAAFLRRNGADITNVRKLFRDKEEDYKAKAACISNAEIIDSFAISICNSEKSESPTIIGAQAANDLLDIIGVKASVVLTEYNEAIYLSARSIDEVNVQLLMERLGGGGHIRTAGAQLVGCKIEDAKQLVIETIKSMVEKGEI